MTDLGSGKSGSITITTSQTQYAASGRWRGHLIEQGRQRKRPQRRGQKAESRMALTKLL